jgi:hypothetical protein
VSKRRAIALVPPAVFSSSTGSGGLYRSNVLRQLSMPTSTSSPSPTWPPCTMTAAAPIVRAASQCCSRILRLGMRILLLGEATLTRYGACT